MNEIPLATEIGTLKHTMSRRLTDPTNHEEPIIKFIEYERCVLDDLHLLLRVTDKFFDLLLLKLIRIDKNKGADLTKRKNLSIFCDFLKEGCKITKAHYVATTRLQFGKIQFRAFNGNERMKIFTELYEPKCEAKPKKKKDGLFLVNLFPKPENEDDSFEREDRVWSGFYSLFKMVKNFPTETTNEERKILIEPIKESLKEWLPNYLALNKLNNHSGKLSPYLHCFTFHYCQMLELHGNIHVFTTQPNEKLNDLCTVYYHNCTNGKKEDKEYLLQLLKKRNRIEFYSLGGSLDDLDDNEDIADDDVTEDKPENEFKIKAEEIEDEEDDDVDGFEMRETIEDELIIKNELLNF